LQAHLFFANAQSQHRKKIKRACNLPPNKKLNLKKSNASKKLKTQTHSRFSMTRQLKNDNGLQAQWPRTPAANSTYPKDGVSCSKDRFVQAESSVLRMKFSGKNPALRVAAKR